MKPTEEGNGYEYEPDKIIRRGHTAKKKEIRLTLGFN